MSSKTREKKRSCEISRSLLDSNDGYLDYVIELWRIGQEIYSEAWNTEFHVFGVIASETDHLPLNSVRKRCSEAMLKKSDVELSNVISLYKSEVHTACNEILAKHGELNA